MQTIFIHSRNFKSHITHVDIFDTTFVSHSHAFTNLITCYILLHMYTHTHARTHTLSLSSLSLLWIETHISVYQQSPICTLTRYFDMQVPYTQYQSCTETHKNTMSPPLTHTHLHQQPPIDSARALKEWAGARMQQGTLPGHENAHS